MPYVPPKQSKPGSKSSSSPSSKSSKTRPSKPTGSNTAPKMTGKPKGSGYVPKKPSASSRDDFDGVITMTKTARSCLICKKKITHIGRSKADLYWCEDCYNSAPGLCAGCEKPITGALIDDGEFKWHPACHQGTKKCHTCNRDIQGKTSERHLFTPDGVEKILYFHSNCWRCNTCNKHLEDGQGTSFIHDGEFICPQCNGALGDSTSTSSGASKSKRTVTKKVTKAMDWAGNKGKETCSSCGKAMKPLDEAIELKGRIYHSDCIVCKKCSKPIDGKVASTKNGHLYHPKCQPSSSKCKRCLENITGAAVALNSGEKYHPACFTCFECDVELKTSYAQMPNGFVYCSSCAAKKQMKTIQSRGPSRPKGPKGTMGVPKRRLAN